MIETKKKAPLVSRSKRSDLAKREESLAYKLLIPTIIILLLIAIYPLGQVFVTSFTDRQFASGQETSFVGFENYRRLLSITIKELPPALDEETGDVKIDSDTGKVVYERPIQILPREPYRYREYKQFNFLGNRYVLGATDPDFIDAIRNTVTFTVISVFLELALGLGIALVVNSHFKGRGAIRASMLIPWAVITVVSARMWEWMLASNRVGFFNTLLYYLGLGDGQIAFLASSNLQLAAMVAVDVWKTTPFMALLLLAGLQTIPNELYEAGDIDGAGKIRQFITITLPLLKPAMAVALVFRTLDALRVFDVFQVLLGQSKYSMASYNYFQLIGNRNMGLASAIGVVIFLIIFVFAISYIKMLGVDSDEA
ncbi:trehalose/maltose transport system permease protein [Natronincola peptidivorans]|uniref:Trehalose/maltose transport system permease protein n=1 Tax=Natronincola peptidivorans TaxID=426128 RepID=A0A1I0A5I8_9FIRM|nr:sugar ABC transporter permease [Natronincola peptidivorans]SES89432.1 trehalose/maltose transport system permease protein [Natronincola peptidivorans]